MPMACWPSASCIGWASAAWWPSAGRRARALQGRFVAQQAYPHCWVWINRGSQPVRLALMLRY